MDHSTLVGYSILLVGHAPDALRHLRRTLEGAGAHVCKATSADEALRFIETAEPSAAVLDYAPDIRGSHRVPERLTRLAIPFVFCKDIGRNEAWPQAPVLSKPVGGADLVETLRRLLRVEIAETTERTNALLPAPAAAPNRPFIC